MASELTIRSAERGRSVHSYELHLEHPEHGEVDVEVHCTWHEEARHGAFFRDAHIERVHSDDVRVVRSVREYLRDELCDTGWDRCMEAAHRVG